MKLIELDAALEGLESLNAICFYEANEHSKEAYLETKDMLKALPIVDAAIVTHGQWINGKCNKCGGHAPFWAIATTYYQSNFCPHCGARMDEKGDEENEIG